LLIGDVAGFFSSIDWKVVWVMIHGHHRRRRRRRPRPPVMEDVLVM
jgi:hypothetical protein